MNIVGSIYLTNMRKSFWNDLEWRDYENISNSQFS